MVLSGLSVFFVSSVLVLTNATSSFLQVWATPRGKGPSRISIVAPLWSRRFFLV